MEVLFWVSVVAIFYAYVGYPLSLMLLSKLRKQKFVYDSNHEPTVSIIIAAANEDDNIVKKLENTLELKYPPEKLQVIISLDEPTDDTEQYATGFLRAYEGTENWSIINNPKGGKEAAQKAAVIRASGDILIFTDVSTELDSYTIYQLVGNFADRGVGGVDGMSKVNGEGGEGVYLKYENKIREWESQLGGTVSFGGCLFAVRKSLVENDFRTDLQSDFRTALTCVKNGAQPIIDRNAIAHFDDTKDGAKEFNRKVRTVVRGINNVSNHLFLLGLSRYRPVSIMFTYQLFCHKVLKWLVPFFMITAFVSNFALALSSLPYAWLFFGQVVFYLISWDAWKNQSENKLRKIMAFFCMSNVGILKAWAEYAQGQRYVMWTPTKR